MTRTPRLLAAVSATAINAAASALPPTVEVEFPLTGLPLLPFGGEYLLASAFNGTVVDAEVRLTLTTEGDFRAENFVFEFAGPTGGVGPVIGSQVGWSGQGTFTAGFRTNSLNGEIPMENNAAPLRFWFMNISPTADSLPTPVQGALGESFVRLTVQPCLLDWNGNFTVSVEDLFNANLPLDRPRRLHRPLAPRRNVRQSESAANREGMSKRTSLTTSPSRKIARVSALRTVEPASFDRRPRQHRITLRTPSNAPIAAPNTAPW